MKAAEWIDKAAEQMGGASDYALAKQMGLTRGGISSYRRGRTHMDDDACIAVAEILGIDPIKVIADQQAERAKTERARAFWKRVTAAAVVIVSTATGVAAPTRSMAYAPSGGVTDYTLCAPRRRRWHRDHPGTDRRRRNDPGRSRPIPGRQPAHAAPISGR